MKKSRLLSFVILALFILVSAYPAQAQLGSSGTSAFTVQNIDDSATATVTVIFVAENGTQITPPVLRAASGSTPALNNNFTLAPGQSLQINVSAVPSLPSGSYSVIIASTARVAAMAGVAGDGPAHFNGSYTGFTEGSPTVYLASSHYNASGWYGLITVQNLGASAANVTLTINCSNGSVGTISRSNIPSFAAYTFDLKATPPTFTPSTSSCVGSAVVTSTNSQPIAVINNQNVPTTGSTNTIEGYPAGSTTVFVPNLSTNYSGWNSALNIRKLGSGSTTVTIDYDDAEPNDTCNLTDATPSCQLVMQAAHPTSGRYGAKITSSNGSVNLITSVGGTQYRNSGAYVGVGPASGAVSVAIPLATKRYYNYISAINCQNVSTTPTTLDFTFSGYPVLHNSTTLGEGESLQVATTGLAFLPNGWYGGVTVTAVNSSARIFCTVGNTNVAPPSVGDWNNQYNAFAK